MAPEATEVVLNTVEIRLASGVLALNRLLMTLQNKRMPVSGINISGDREETRAAFVLDCPQEMAQRYATLLEGLEDVEQVRMHTTEPLEGQDTGRPNYDGRRFASVENSATGEVGPETVFHYHQDGDVVWATYDGGAVRRGTLIARSDDTGNLEARYGHVNASGELMTGECRSTPEVLPDGRIRLREEWRWTSGDRSSGGSIVEEIKDRSLEGGR